MSTEEAPKAQETRANEPVEGGAADAAADALLVSVAPTVYTGVSFAALALLIIGTTLPWMYRDYVLGAVSYTTTVSLWETKTQGSDGTVVITTVIDNGCDKYTEYVRTAQAFAVGAIIVAGLGLLVGLGARFAGKSLKPLGVVAALFAFVAALVAWAVMARVYYQTFCAQPSYDAQRFYVSSGAGVFITGWVLTLVAFVVALRDVRVPKVLPAEAVDKFVAVIFTFLAFATLAFVIVATPISFISKWTSATTEERITLWYKYTYVDGDQVSKDDVTESTCGDLSKYMRFGQSFAIISIGLALLALVAGLLAVAGKFGKKALLIFGFGAALAAFITLASQLAVYYKTFCSGSPSFDEQKYHRDAGLALFAAAGCAMVFAFLLALVVALTQLCATPAEGGNTRVTALLYIVGTVVSLVLMVVSLTMPVFATSQDNDYVRVNWWDVSMRTGATYTETEFTCQEIWQRLVGGGSLGIAAIALSAFGAMLGIGQLSSSSLRKPASATTLLAAAAQLAAWGLAMSVYQGHFCDFTPYNSGFKYAAGFGLMVAAFCINAVVSALNLLVAA